MKKKLFQLPWKKSDELAIEGLILVVLAGILCASLTTVMSSMSAANDVLFYAGFAGLVIWLGVCYFTIRRAYRWGRDVGIILKEKMK